MCTEFAFAALIILHVGGKWIYQELPPRREKRSGCHGAEDVVKERVNTRREGGEAETSGLFFLIVPIDMNHLVL